jgi:hypothetical protein
VLFAATWNVSLDSLWRQAVRSGIGVNAPWVFCTNGREWRLVDTQRTYSRAYIQFDLQQTLACWPTFRVFWGVFRNEAFRDTAGGPPLVIQIVQSSARHGQAVSDRSGSVIDAVQHLLGARPCGRRALAPPRRS